MFNEHVPLYVLLQTRWPLRSWIKPSWTRRPRGYCPERSPAWRDYTTPTSYVSTRSDGHTRAHTHTLLIRNELHKAWSEAKIISAVHLNRVYQKTTWPSSLCLPAGWQVVETLSRLHLVMEYAAGGELYTKISMEGKLSDIDSKIVFSQILSAVKHMVWSRDEVLLTYPFQCNHQGPPK